MFIRNVTLALRNIKRDGAYSAIKIGGLALGLATSIVLFLYVYYQFTYDSGHPDVDRLYRVNMSHIWRPGGGIFHSTGPAVAQALEAEFPEIEQILRINTPGPHTVRYIRPNGSSVAFNEGFNDIFAADSTFFSFFNFRLKEGDPATALVGQNKVVISEEAARKLFGDEPALGKQLQIAADGAVSPDGGPFDPTASTLVEVTGVTEKQPRNMHFHFDYMLSMATNPRVKAFEWSWIWTQVVTYIKVRPGTDVSALQAKLHHFGDRHAPATFEKLGMDYQDFVAEKGNWSLFLQPVRDIHLHSGSMTDNMSIGNRLGPTGDITFVYMMIGVGCFILLIAIINFVNLSTARAANRTKEVGVKKTLGVGRGLMIMQFQIEHILVAIIAVIAGLAIMEILRLTLLPLNIYIPLTDINPYVFILIIVGFAVAIGFLAGLYPAFYLTHFRPAEVLKGRVASGFKSGRLRNALVVFQFSIAIALMGGTVIVFQQLNFFLSADVGFDRDNLITIQRGAALGDKIDAFRNELLEIPGITSASISSNFRQPAEDLFTKESDDRRITLSQYKIDEHFVATTGLRVAAGRTFQEDNAADKDKLIINEATAKLLGWEPEEAIGKRIVYLGDGGVPSEIIGVLKDFHFQSLYEVNVPIIFYHLDAPVWGGERMITVRYTPQNISSTVAGIEGKWSRVAPEMPIEYSFYDDDHRKQYEAEERMSSLFLIFTTLAMLIAVVGLVGLVSYSAEQRKKEIGIRKVFGASMSRIYLLLNIQYVRLILISLIIATPVTWIFMQRWLDGYAYRININAWVFVATGAAALFFALACVGYIALRAASVNPSKVLKDE